MSDPRSEARSARRSAAFLCAFRVAILVAAAVSAALYVQYRSPAEATFCGLDSGCEAVRRSGLASFGNPLLSLPFLGLAAYATVYVVSLVAPAGVAPLALAGAGAAVALGLVATQALVVRAFCSLCLLVDVAAIAAALFAWLHRRSGPGSDPLRPSGWAWLFVAAVAAPFAWAQVKAPLAVPAVIRQLYVAGKVNIVEFADFECPHCRELHPAVRRVLAEQPPGRVHFIRGHVPLPFHTEARPAARAMVCAEEQGKDDVLADRLVEVTLQKDTIAQAVAQTGVDVAAFAECLRSKRPDARIEADSRRLKAAGMAGLPTTYVGEQRLLGAVPETKLRDSIERAARGEDAPKGVSAPAFAAALAALLAALAWFGREPRVTLAHEQRD